MVKNWSLSSKKVVLAIFGLLLIVSPSYAAISDDLSSCFNLDESTQPYLDVYGGFSGLTTDAPLQSPGIINYGQGFSGAGQYIAIDNMMPNVTGQGAFNGTTNKSWSFQFWVRLSAMPNDNRLALSATNYSTEGGYFGLNRVPSSSHPMSSYWHMINSDGGITGVSANWSLNNWQHYVITYNHSTNFTTSLYWNGTLSDTNITPSTSEFELTGFNNTLRLGSRTGYSTITGTLDQLTFWKRALNDEEVSYLYNTGDARSCETIIAGALTSDVIQLTAGFPASMTGDFYYNKTSGNIVYTWNDVLQSLSSTFFTTYTLNSSGTNLINTNTSFDHNGTMKYNISSLLDSGADVVANAWIIDPNRAIVSGNRILVGTLWVSESSDLLQNVPKPDGSILAAFIIATMGLIGVATRSSVATLTLTSIGLLFASQVLFDISSGFVWIVIIGLASVLLFAISKVRSS